MMQEFILTQSKGKKNFFIFFTFLEITTPDSQLLLKLRESSIYLISYILSIRLSLGTIELYLYHVLYLILY